MASKFEERAYFSEVAQIRKRRKIIPARIQLQPRIILNRINSTPHPSNSFEKISASTFCVVCNWAKVTFLKFNATKSIIIFDYFFFLYKIKKFFVTKSRNRMIKELSLSKFINLIFNNVINIKKKDITIHT